jgi:hypothetical protein
MIPKDSGGAFVQRDLIRSKVQRLDLGASDRLDGRRSWPRPASRAPVSQIARKYLTANRTVDTLPPGKLLISGQ